MNHNDKLAVQTVHTECMQKLQQFVDEPYKKDTTDVVEQAVQDAIDRLTDRNVVEQNKPVTKVQMMWESFTLKQKIIHTICNKLIPVISRYKRSSIDKQNIINIIEDEECTKIKYPYWAVNDPKGIILVDLEIRPVSSLNFINIKIGIGNENRIK